MTVNKRSKYSERIKDVMASVMACRACGKNVEDSRERVVLLGKVYNVLVDCQSN